VGPVARDYDGIGDYWRGVDLGSRPSGAIGVACECPVKVK
jgi:hypothetical protein